MGKLFNRICELNTLREAWSRIRAKGAQGGIDGVSVEAFSKGAERHLRELAEDLRGGKYAPEPATRVHTPKFNAAKEFRTLSLPTIKDKVAQQAVRMLIEPLFENRFLDSSYAYRQDKGPRKAIGRVTHYLTHEAKRWAVFGDIDNFFDSLNHERLIQEVRRVIFEQEILTLIRMWLKIGAVDKRGRYHDMDLGISQGGIISPLLSNIYAHPLDVQMVASKTAYVRYADNFVALHASQEEAQQSLQSITDFLQQSLQLRLNPESNPVRSVEAGFVFLGVNFRGSERLLAEEKADKIRRKIDWLTPKKRPQSLHKILDEVRETTEGVRQYYGFLEPWESFEALDQYLLGRLRVLLDWQRQSGRLKTKKELREILKGPLFFDVRDQARVDELTNRLVDEVFAKQDKPAARPSREDSGKDEDKAGEQTAERKVAAKKRQYVKKDVLESEVIVYTPGIVIGHRNNRVVLSLQRKIVLSRPLIRVKSLLIQARGVSMSSDLVEACAKAEVPIVFSKPGGDCYAMVHASQMSSRPDLGLIQIKAIDNGSALAWAKEFVLGKVRNQLNLLKFYLRHRDDEDPVYAAKMAEAEPKFERLQEKVEEIPIALPYEQPRNQLFAYEGQAGALYWEVVRLLLPKEIDYPGRVTRGATDLVNACLNYGYSLLYPRIERALLLAGLNVYASLLHAPQDGKPSLSFDLIEPFRAPVVDRAVFSMLTRGRNLSVTTAGRLTSESARLVVEAVLGRLGSLVPYRSEKLTLEQVIQKQSYLLARSLRGEARFRSFIARY